MKKFFEGVMEWKTAAALMFSGSVILYSIVMALLGQHEISIMIITSLLIVSSIGTFLQQLAFGDRMIKKMRYTMRCVVFILPFFVLLTLNALAFRWFPLEQSGAWLLFTIIFLVVFVIMTAGFEIYYRITGKKYDGLLGQYRQSKGMDK